MTREDEFIQVFPLLNNKLNIHDELLKGTFVSDLVEGAPMAGKSSESAVLFSNYDFIGFDLDNTLCTYNLKNLFTNHYQYVAAYLNRTNRYNIPEQLTAEAIDFISRGLIIDVESKNLLKVTADGDITRASHGTKVLTSEEVSHKYGKKKRWKALDEVITSDFHNWKGKSEMYSFMDFTDAAFTVVYALAADSDVSANQVWNDVIDGIRTMYTDENWLGDILSKHNLYINKTSKKVLKWIKELKKGRKIGLITSNYPELVPQLATLSLGPNWSSLFDLIVYEAKKPRFFSDQVPFLDLNGRETTFELTGSYTNGCMKTIQETLLKELDREPKCLYIGDSPYHDFMFTGIDYIAIVEELKAEGLFPGSHPSSDFLNSTIWGSYLFEGEKSTIFGKYALNSVFCSPDLDFFADKPIDSELVCNLRGHSGKFSLTLA